MDADRLLNSLRLDGPRLAALAAGHLDDPVPGCPGWSVRDLVLHVAEVYQHKVLVLREGKPPNPWPIERGDIDPIEHLRSSHELIVAELTARPLDEPAWIWGADPAEGNVAWWVRRMAQETAVHLWDAEEAAGELRPIDPDVAVDGIDEFIAVFMTAANTHYFAELAPDLVHASGEVVEVSAGGRSWSVALHPDRLDFAPNGAPAVTVRGEPEAVLLWLWGRLGDAAVTVTGESAIRVALRKVLDAVGQ